MISEAKEIIAKLNSPSDWAIVGGAGVIGFVLDAAINIVPLPVFSPGVCGITAAFSALTVKRGAEAGFLHRKEARRRSVLLQEAQRCIAELRKAAPSAADDLEWDLRLDGNDMEKLEEIVRRARVAVKPALVARAGIVPALERGGRFFGGGPAVQG